MADSDRVAELKRKMQEKALQAKAQQAAADGSATAAPPAASQASAPPTQAPPVANPPVAGAADSASAESVASDAQTSVLSAEAATEPFEVASDGSETAAALHVEPHEAPAVAPLPAHVAAPTTNGDIPGEAYALSELTPEELAARQMTRRELLTYAWAGALGLVVLGTGFATFEFMYPRFKAGEFGGQFFLGDMSTMPPVGAPPLPNTSGKFWLVNTTEEGVKALYMVCTHLGCLYKWGSSAGRFECPCHGSKFSREGFYIEGPAPRSLDRFEVAEVAGVVVVDTGAKITGAPSAESPARAVPV